MLMENSKKKSGGVEIPKRNRSLDLKSLYDSKFSEVLNSKKKVSDENGVDDAKKKKRKNRKEVPLSCFESDAKKSRKENVNGVKSESGSGQKLNDKSEGLHGLSLGLGNNVSSFNIPKRPRGSVGRKKVESDQGSEPTKLPNSDDSVRAFKAEDAKYEDAVGPSDRKAREVALSSANDCVSKFKSVQKVHGSNKKSKQKSSSKSAINSSGSNVKQKRKVGGEEVRETRNDQSASVQNVMKGKKNNGDKLRKKQQSNSRKKKDLVVCRDGDDASVKKSEPSVGSSSDRVFSEFVDDDDDDDEENLEQNAARMLSSRFDPNCTGFSSKRKSSVSLEADGLSQDSLFRRLKSFDDGQSPSADDKSRTLRPRTENRGKGVARKRRHFYDVVAQNLDPHWVLNRRIKIFWPLDESWYHGLVDDYNSDTRHHHIKYDDREEEWVDLREETFKLLLFPSEVPDKPKSRKRSKRDQDLPREQTVPSADNDSCIGDPLDSEPIASWLASQSQRVKALPKSPKRQRTSQRHPQLVSSLPSEKTDNSNSDVVDSKEIINYPDCEPASADSLPFQGTGINCQLESASILGSASPAVYFRKRYHKTREGVSSLSRIVKPRGSSPWAVKPLSPVIVGSPPTKEGIFCRVGLDSDKRLWSFNDKGEYILNDLLLEAEEFRFQICLLPPLEFSCDIGIFRLLHDMFMLQHGVMMTTSPAVILEIFLIDSYFGLRLLLSEGGMEQALAFVFQILTVFSQSHEQWDGDMKLPVTSIRFQLSSFQDPRKRHVFAFYSFSRLNSSRWLYLDSKILRHCLLIKKLPVSECTYDNINKLQCGSFQLHKPRGDLKHYLNQGFKKNNMPGVLPMSVMRETYNSRISQPASSLAAKAGKVPQFILSFPAAPTFFLSLHLQLLMEHSFAWVNLQHQDAPCSPGSSDNAECVQFEPSCGAVQEDTTEIEVRKLDTEPPANYQQDLGMDIVFANNAANNTGGILGNECVPKKAAQKQIDISARTSVPTSITSGTSNLRRDSTSGVMMIDIPSSEQVLLPSDGKAGLSRSSLHKSSPIGSRRSWQHGGSSSISSPLGHHSPVLPDGKSNFTPNGFGNGPKKPRTQVQYTLPFAGFDLSEKPKTPSSRSVPCKRIRRASLKRISDGSGNNQKNVELQTCVSNVLVTHEDKGWREYGAHIVLEVADHNEWRLAVKLSGVTKYSYKVKHILQPGSTNRYSHAMMWKGGKDWVLEFPDRSQWTLFKEMHEECYDRNIRAASVKNIPIPGVRLVEESDDYGTDVPFVRNPMKYFRQVQTDVEMAMDPSHILYDIDSDDEKWLMEHNSRADKPAEISEEFFEKAINMFEKVSYSRHRDNFTDDEIKELAIGIGSESAAKVVCEHWKQKRKKMGMPLIRHLQPPLWERYQQQLKEYEHSAAHGNYAFSVGSKEMVHPPEKPPMFAFCLKPRGLEVPNKGSKQRSHRRLPVSGHHQTSSVDQDGFVFGRRSNGHAFGDDKLLYDSSDVSPSLKASTRMLSPRDAHFALSNGVTKWKGNSKLYKNKSKKQLGPSYPSFQNQRSMALRNGVQQWNSPEFSNRRQCFLEKLQLPHRQGLEQLDSSDLNEFRIRDASCAAQHARNLAKLKRERAQKLFDMADYAMHKAARSLMAAEAMKECCGNSNN